MIEKRIKRQVVGKPQRFFAVVQPGFEAVARRELSELGIEGAFEEETGGIEFTSRLDGCYRVNLGARTITRVLMRLFEVKATSFRELRRKVEALPFELHIADGADVGFQVKSSRSRLSHEGAVEDHLRRSIAARLGMFGAKVEFPVEGAAQTIHLRVTDDVCQFSLDTTGTPLYLRGRKPNAATATLRETTAASILMASGWPDYDVLIDPMCGAGTFTLEALEMAAGRLPNAERSFPFTDWPAFRPKAYAHLKQKMIEDAAATGRTRRIMAFDLDPDAVETTRKNLATAGLPADQVSVETGDFTDPLSLDGFADLPQDARTLLVLNPPYGKRLAGGNTKQLYRRIGEAIRHHYHGAYAILVPGLEVEKALSVPREKKILFQNGGLLVAAILHTEQEHVE